MTTARSIDRIFTTFALTELGRAATSTELDQIAAWPWPRGFVPTPGLLCELLVAIRAQARAPSRLAHRRFERLRLTRQVDRVAG